MQESKQRLAASCKGTSASYNIYNGDPNTHWKCGILITIHVHGLNAWPK